MDENKTGLSNEVFISEPKINVISKEEFTKRVEKVFHLLWETLAKSFGPYGAPTLIYNYPFSHVTKDGFTIMKNLSMNAKDTLLDQAIADMAADICGRLNYTVGDGTTTAVIATNSVFKAYREAIAKGDVTFKNTRPRDIIKKYNEIKDEVVEELKKHVTSIRTQDMEELKKNIAKVVYVSSNGDELMTSYISDLYKELGCPGITSVLAADGVTKARLVNGYKYDLMLRDRLYINSDDKTMVLDNTDVIIFSHRVTIQTYDEILKPLNAMCRMRGRHLIVAAPFYDEVAIIQKIAKELKDEFEKKKDINMVLMTYRNTSANARRLLEDFAILANTEIVSQEKEKLIRDDIKRGVNIESLFNLDNRGIEGSVALAINPDVGKYIPFKIGDNEKLDPGYLLIANNEKALRIGFFESCKLGLTSSLFTGKFHANESLYNAALEDAENTLNEKEKKYQKLGTFSAEVSQAQDRLYALKLKMGVIEVGADSELSQKLLRDSVDDAIKAATSAFNHGTVLGCNVDLINSIDEVSVREGNKEKPDQLKLSLLSILGNGFEDVYRTVLLNAFDDIEINNRSDAEKFCKEVLSLDDSDTQEFIDRVGESKSVISAIINTSLENNEVFDLSTSKFSKDVINSVETDEQVLTAVVDLIALLITGNQVVVTERNNF